MPSELPDLPGLFNDIDLDGVQSVLDQILSNAGNVPLPPIRDNVLPGSGREGAPDAGVLLVYYDTVSFGGHFKTERRASLNIDWREEEFEPFPWRDDTMRFSVMASTTMVPDISGSFSFKARCGGDVVVYVTDAQGRTTIAASNFGSSLVGSSATFAGVRGTRDFTAGESMRLQAGQSYAVLIAAVTTEPNADSSQLYRYLQVILSTGDSDFPIPPHWSGACVMLMWGVE